MISIRTNTMSKSLHPIQQDESRYILNTAPCTRGKTAFTKQTFVPEYILNTALCQSPPSVSKTKKAINFIKHVALLARLNSGNKEDGIHHMTCIATNKNLEETKQWKIRTKNSFKHLNIVVLSSKKGDTNNIQLIKSMLVDAKKADDLPDIIIFCTHQKRMDDMVELTKSLNNGNLDFTKIGIYQITTTTMFDEADANIELIVELIKELNKALVHGNYTVRDFHFITATPFKWFWETLNNHGIKKLKNINEIIKQADPDSDLHLPHEELMKNYRYIDEHSIHLNVTDSTKNPSHYAKIILNEIIKERTEGKRTGPLTIFAPAKKEIKSHREMREIFFYPGSNFCVVIHNGEYKGFWYPSGDFTSFESFRKENNMAECEFKDILVKWRELNPDTDLMITGFMNIQRGITFCTKGFNFTDLIVSTYHLGNINSLIQLLGRANGGKEYVEIMNIWAPPDVIKKANEQIKIVNDLLANEPEEFEESQFRKKTVAEINEPAMTVPVIIELTDEEMDSIKKKGRSWDETRIKELIALKNPQVTNDIESNNCKKDQILEPQNAGTIRKQLTVLVNGAETGQKKMTSIKKKNKNSNVYQVFLDKNSSPKRLIVSLFYGERLSSEPTNEIIEGSSSDEEEN